MKKLITILLAGLLSLTAAACSGTQETAKTDSATADTAQVAEPEDLVVSETYYNVYAYDEENPDEKAPDTVTAYEYEFNSKGLPVKTTAKTDGKVVSVKETEYDAAGNVVRLTVFDADGSKTFTYAFEYDDDHNKVRFITYDAEDSLSSVISYEYDENGFLISESYQSDDYAYTIKHENDKDGKEIASVQYDADGKELMKTESECDSDGRLIRKNQSYSYGETSGSSNVAYEYDDRGNNVKEVCYDADGTILYSYDRVYKTVKDLCGK